jgi:hypothetical protein
MWSVVVDYTGPIWGWVSDYSKEMLDDVDRGVEKTRKKQIQKTKPAPAEETLEEEAP